MKKILYLSFYFEPDLCAGSFRNSPLARELAKQVKGLADIHVITTLPNRYSSFSAEAPRNEKNDNLHIDRISLPRHQSGFKDQIFAFWHYYKAVRAITHDQSYDLVFASSSRLFTAYLGYRIARKQRVPLYLDIRDIFTDTLNDVIPNKLVKIALLPVLTWIERRTFGAAQHINLISAGFKSYFQRYQGPAYSFFSNGIDPEFMQPELSTKEVAGKPVIITYAGNIGEGQGLHKLLPQAAQSLGDGYLFKVIGDGGAKTLLASTIADLGITNVVLEKPVKRDALLQIYAESDYLLMHLNDYKAFEKVLPSKVFELGAFPRPMIAGVNGYAREFIQTHIPDAILIAPTDHQALTQQLQEHTYGAIRRTAFITQFTRQRINAEMAQSIKAYL